MASSRSDLTKTERDRFVDPAEQFVTDFTGLITAVDRLMVDIGGAIRTEMPAVKPNGHARPLTLSGTISTLHNHAHSFLKSLKRLELPLERNGTNHLKGNGNPPPLSQLAVTLARAQDPKTMADTVKNYCATAFRSPAGMIFVERDGTLQLVSHWPAGESPKKTIVDEIRKKGPVLRAFQTGAPVFWRQERQSNIGRFLCGFLRRCHGDSVTFLPISAPGQRPLGVLAVALSRGPEFPPVVYDDLVQLAEIVSGYIERARAYDEAVAARVRAEDATRSKDEFLSILSHELKNPMMPILGWAVALSSGTLPAGKQNVALEGIIRNVRALNYLIEDLFDAMRISTGKFRLELAQTRIQDVAREALTAIQNTLENKKLRISTDISEGIPAFMADPRRLHQVLINLLNNAVKFTPEGGFIALRVRRYEHCVECSVSDSGKGIERDFLPFVFDRFRQEKSSSKVHSAGLGLGLAIVREIVELHGGSIEAFSNGSHKGARFIVRLPIVRKRPRLASENKSSAGHSEKTTQNIRSNSDTRQSA
jgi:signal transduction histidine kinase